MLAFATTDLYSGILIELFRRDFRGLGFPVRRSALHVDAACRAVTDLQTDINRIEKDLPNGGPPVHSRSSADLIFASFNSSAICRYFMFCRYFISNSMKSRASASDCAVAELDGLVLSA